MPDQEQISAEKPPVLNGKKINPDNPLYLPVGSVRSIIAIVCLFICGMMIVSQNEVPEWFVSMTSMVVAFYFGGKSINGNGGLGK